MKVNVGIIADQPRARSILCRSSLIVSILYLIDPSRRTGFPPVSFRRLSLHRSAVTNAHAHEPTEVRTCLSHWVAGMALILLLTGTASKQLFLPILALCFWPAKRCLPDDGLKHLTSERVAENIYQRMVILKTCPIRTKFVSTRDLTSPHL